jgi:ribosomal peptide maturation radical SAM protein 1
VITIRIVLVQMPWGALDTPSLAAGIMESVSVRAGHEVIARYANLDFADWASQRLGLTGDQYRFFSDRSYFLGLGDWAFAGVMYSSQPPDTTIAPEYEAFLRDNGVTDEELALAKTVRAHTPEFIAQVASDLAGLCPDVAGFTTAFQQNAASLAAARALKQASPRTRTVFGGANCDGPQGAALHRAFPFVDFVVRGEGELAFPELLSALADSGTGRLTGIAGLCHRAADGTTVANPMATRPLPPASIAAPRYGAYFDRLDSCVAAAWAEPKLLVEGARGCWWGEKHHCTFCGLNGSSMQFRSKPAGDFVTEVLDLAERHQILDFIVVDNILDPGYFGSALPALAATGYDLRLHFEVKANLRREQFSALRRAGVVQVQPGVENLSTRVLRIMDKGVSGCQNVRALRDAQSAGVTMTWNYLYGFPGETDEDYTAVIDQMPALHHLDPPTGQARIVIERFSPYFDRPDLGFDILRPAIQYRHTYQLPEPELMELAYLFMAPQRGIGDALAGQLAEAVGTWTSNHPDSSLTWEEVGKTVLLLNTRPGYPWRTAELRTPAELEMFRLLDRPRSLAGLAARVPGGEQSVRDLAARWHGMGLLFTDGGHLVHVATEADNQLLMRVQQRVARRADWWEATAGRFEEHAHG